MKSLLMIAALVGIGYSSIAQQKTTKHKTTTTHKKTAAKTLAKAEDCKGCESGKSKYTERTVAMGGREATWHRLLNCSKAKRIAAAKRKASAGEQVVETKLIQPSGLCYSYKRNNILVTECPDLMSRTGEIEISSQSMYGGYYPRAIIVTVNPVLAPQSNVINNNRGLAPSGGNYCGPNCSSQ